MEQIINNIDIKAIKIQHLIIVLFLFIVIDIATGILNAILNKDLESKKMKTGIVGKIYELSIVAISLLLDSIFNLNMIANSVCIFYIVQEGLSILENTGQYISYPQFIKNILSELKGGIDNGK